MWILVAPCIALKWGKEGHSISASIAQSLLNARASQRAKDLLSGATLSSIASWADDIRRYSEWSWTGPLHYIDTPQVCDYDRQRDCHDEHNNPMFCVDGAIQNFSKALMLGGRGAGVNASDALKFVVHFVGDIHQPLHCAFTLDRGGNSIKGHFYDKSDNLHAIWDTDILTKRIHDDFGGSHDSYEAFLLHQIRGEWAADAQAWVACTDANKICSADWGSESVALACSVAYNDVDGTRLSTGFQIRDPYYHRAAPVVDTQIAKAGVRMAHVLNTVFEQGV